MLSNNLDPRIGPCNTTYRNDSNIEKTRKAINHVGNEITDEDAKFKKS